MERKFIRKIFLWMMQLKRYMMNLQKWLFLQLNII